MNPRTMPSSRAHGLAIPSALAAALLLAVSVSPADARGCRRDADCDGLSNHEERTLGTSRADADSDHDGLSDAAEVRKLSSNPLDADSDHDGIDDGDEVAGGTDPVSGDSDDDGTSDGEDHDPSGELRSKLVGPVGSVDAAAQTVGMFGCLVVDASTAELDGFALADLTPGTVVKIELDGAALPALVARSIEREGVAGSDDDGHDDGGSDDDGSDPGDGDGDGHDDGHDD